jgi:hypothetical protein
MVRRIRRALILGAACLPAIALAQDDGGGVRMSIGLEQRFEAGRNLDLDVPAEGTSAIASTRLSFGLLSRTPIEQLEFSTGLSLTIENDDGTEIEVGRPELRFGYTREVPDGRLAVTARFRRDDVSAFDLADFINEEGELELPEGFDSTDDEGTRTDYGVAMRYETGRTAPLGLIFDLGYSRTDYADTIDPDLNDIERVNLGAEARLRFSDALTGTVGVRYSREDEDDIDQTRTVRTTAEVGADYAATPRLTVSGRVGVTEIETETLTDTTSTTGPVARLGLGYAMPNGVATADLTFDTTEDEDLRVSLLLGRQLALPTGSFAARVGITAAEDAGTDLIGGITWVQRLPDGQIDLRLDRSVRFNDDDENEVNTILVLGWDRRVNPMSSVGLGFTYAISDAPAERVEQADLSARYSYTLTRDWTLDSGLRYRVRDDADGRAESPSVFVSLGRRFEF